MVKAGQDTRYPNALEHMIAENLKSQTSACPHGQTPTEEEIFGNLTGFLAGVGNSSRLVVTSVLMLGRHRECQQRILEELHKVVGEYSDEDARAAAVAGER